MRVLSWESLPTFGQEAGPTAAAVGAFDGLHVGHRRLVGEIVGREGLASLVVTFRENPKRRTMAASYRGDLSSPAQKLEILESLGVDACVLIDFSSDFSKLTGRNFLTLLRNRGGVRFLAAGVGFRCGYRLDSGAAEIKAHCESLGVETSILEPVRWRGSPVSSSRIRGAIEEGRLEEASAMLGRPYELEIEGLELPSPGLLAASASTIQVAPPLGLYEAELAAAGESRAAWARLGEGRWSIRFDRPIEAIAASARLRLARMVSRE